MVIRPAGGLVVALAILGFTATDTAAKSWPDPWSSSFPSRILLVGCNSAGADSAHGHFEIVIRDLPGNPVANVTVICELSANSDLRIASDQRDPRLRVVCAHRTVYTLTDVLGRAPFTIIGGGPLAPGPPGVNDVFSIQVDGMPFATVPCSAFDLDGTSGVGMGDLSVWAADFFGNLDSQRSDYDGNGHVTLADLSLWAAVFFGGGSIYSSSCCP